MALAMEAREGFRSLRLLCLSYNRSFGFSTKTSLSRFPAAVGELTVPNDDTEILSVVPIAFF